MTRAIVAVTWFAVIAIVLLGVLIARTHARLRPIQGRCRAAFTPLLALIGQRHDLARECIAMLRQLPASGSVAGLEQARASALASLMVIGVRTPSGVTLRELMLAEAALSVALGAGLAELDSGRVPDAATCREKIGENDRRIRESIDQYNDTVLEFRLARASFPESLLAATLRYVEFASLEWVSSSATDLVIRPGKA